MLEFMRGDMFAAPADIRVNTVNCVGVMGAGVALAFKQRYPEMFRHYQRDCRDGLVQPGKMHIWRSLSGDWIVNFPTKRDWREPSRYEDIEAGLDDLRAYLNAVGPVTVTLPALGCGNGGLDWGRVADMIRNKLDGVGAHVLIFEPSASRRTIMDAPNGDELEATEKLGYRLVRSENVLELGSPTPVYVYGKHELLSRKWIALMPSRAPGEREIQALSTIATQLARSRNGVTVALIYGARVSEEIAQLFVSRGVDTVLLIPFGVLTRKSIIKQSMMSGFGALTLASLAPANAKWSRLLLAQTMEMLRANAASMLLSDPDPGWLTNKGMSKWANARASYIRYETTPPHVRETLAGIGARPIARRGENGVPNIDYLVGSSPIPGQAGLAAGKYVVPDIVDGREVFTVTVGELSSALKRELFDALLHMDTRRLDLTIRVPQELSDDDLRSLMALGFCRRGPG